MRQDQYERLQALEEKLTDVFLEEAEPDHWSGAGLLPNELDQKARGDRYWCKKNAVATLAVVQRIGAVVQAIGMAGDGDDEAGIDGEVAAAEKEAARLLSKLQERGARAHGKP